MEQQSQSQFEEGPEDRPQGQQGHRSHPSQQAAQSQSQSEGSKAEDDPIAASLRKQIEQALDPVLADLRNVIAHAVEDSAEAGAASQGEEDAIESQFLRVQEQAKQATRAVDEALRNLPGLAAGKADETTGYKRVNLNLSPSAHRELQALASDKGKTVSEVIREAIILSRWFYDVMHEDATHLLIEHDGKTREIVPIQ